MSVPLCRTARWFAGARFGVYAHVWYTNPCTNRHLSIRPDMDTVVVETIRHLALVDDLAPDFVGLWTPTSEDYRRELRASPGGKLTELHIDCLDPFSLVSAEVSSLSKHMRNLVRIEVPVLGEAATHLFAGSNGGNSGGKKIRATMVLLTARALRKQGSSNMRQRKLAEIIEIVHTASLFHDDVIDGADTRRGCPSVSAKFGDKVAILAGDFLLARACVALAKLENLAVVELISVVIEHLVRGEIIQMRPESGTSDTHALLEAYLQKTFYKTGSLMANACRAAALLEDETQANCDAAFAYGRHVGLAFQLVDDILDFEASDLELGKPALADLQMGLVTAFACVISSKSQFLFEVSIRLIHTKLSRTKQKR
mmetsp:Transcript_10166/g.32295  ORF Transcript_10166/g.32295 Transcript_10166/m.32295 type:complete len:370 (+) Transcript_10166:70-1179(+)